MNQTTSDAARDLADRLKGHVQEWLETHSRNIRWAVTSITQGAIVQIQVQAWANVNGRDYTTIRQSPMLNADQIEMDGDKANMIAWILLDWCKDGLMQQAFRPKEPA